MQSSRKESAQLLGLQDAIRALQEENAQLQLRLRSGRVSPMPPSPALNDNVTAGVVAPALGAYNAVGVRASVATGAGEMAAESEEVTAQHHRVDALRTEAALLWHSNEALLRENKQLHIELSELAQAFEGQSC